MMDQPLQLAFGLILVVLFLQTLVLLYCGWQLRRRFAELNRNLDSMAAKLSQGLEKLRGIAGGLAQRTKRLPEWEVSLRKGSAKLMEAVRSGNQALVRLLERMQEQTASVAKKLDQGMQSFSHYSYQVHRAIIHPAGKISEALQAAAGMAQNLFSRSSSSHPAEFVAEEEEFI